MFSETEKSNVLATIIFGLTANIVPIASSAVPARFGSISSPTDVSIVTPELSSISTPALATTSVTTLRSLLRDRQ
jgi:hypothetical protein